MPSGEAAGRPLSAREGSVVGRREELAGEAEQGPGPEGPGGHCSGLELVPSCPCSILNRTQNRWLRECGRLSCGGGWAPEQLSDSVAHGNIHGDPGATRHPAGRPDSQPGKLRQHGPESCHPAKLEIGVVVA